MPIFRNRLDFYFGISEILEMDPATAIIRKLGGEAKVAGIAGTALSAPYRWQHEKSRGGTGGLIPQAHHRRLLRERGTPQDAVGKMKISESIDIEFLQAERLQDFFAFHCRRPIREVMEVSGHNLRVPYSKLFLRVVVQSRLRPQRKINRCQMTRAGPGASTAAAPPDASARLNALARQYAPSTFEETERAGGRNAIDKLDRRAFKGAAGISRERHILCKDRRRHQCEIPNRLFPQRRDRPRQANGTCSSGAAKRLAQAAAERQTAAAAQTTRTPRAGIHGADAEVRARGDRQAPLRRDRSAPSFADGS